MLGVKERNKYVLSCCIRGIEGEVTATFSAGAKKHCARIYSDRDLLFVFSATVTERKGLDGQMNKLHGTRVQGSGIHVFLHNLRLVCRALYLCVTLVEQQDVLNHDIIKI